VSEQLVSPIHQMHIHSFHSRLWRTHSCDALLRAAFTLV
jgi:hypothetical protein